MKSITIHGYKIVQTVYNQRSITIKFFIVFTLLLTCFGNIYAQNPYLPLWEYIADGEPHIFEDPDKPGENRVYLYGSHDILKSAYCGKNLVAWSAPVNDLSNWRYDGIIFESKYNRNGDFLNADSTGDVLFAPDVVVRVENGRKVYYLFPNNQTEGRRSQIAKSFRPDGPFIPCNWNAVNQNLSDGVLSSDPSVLIDDDGRVYAYWGFKNSHMAELDPVTMCTVKPGCKVLDDVLSGMSQEGIFHFFEASSMRKIKDKYVFVYSRLIPNGEFGLHSSPYNLSWAYSEHPLGPFTYGGILIDARARDIDPDTGKAICTAQPCGNTQGGIVEINGQWWVFYHRQTGTDEFSRQAMVAPINVEVEEGPGGKVHISEAEYNSEGFCVDGLNPLHKSAAGWACYLTEPQGVIQRFPNVYHSGSYVRPSRYEDCDLYVGPFNLKDALCPVVNNTSGSVVGYKYFNMDKTKGLKNLKLLVNIRPLGIDGTIDVLFGAPSVKHGGVKIGTITISRKDKQNTQYYEIAADKATTLSGKQPLFFVFNSRIKATPICELHDFQFK